MRRLILRSFRPTPVASYQWTSARKIRPMSNSIESAPTSSPSARLLDCEFEPELLEALGGRAPADHEVGLASLRSGRHSGATESWKSRRMRTVMSRAAAGKPPAPVSESALARARHGERVVLRQGRKAVAAVVSIADLRLLQKLEDEEDLRDVRAARVEMKRKGTIPWEKVKAELGLK